MAAVPLAPAAAPGPGAALAADDALPPRAHLVVFVLWLMVFSSGSQVMLISPIFPRIREQLGIGAAALGHLVAIDAIMLGLVALLAGPISDRVGRRRILLTGTGMMALALGLHAFAFNYGSLLFARALAGASGGVLSGAAVAYVGDYFPYRRRGWATGWVMTGMAFGQIIGIPAGTVIAAHSGFRAAYLLFGACMTATFVLVWRVVPQPNVPRERTPLTVLAAAAAYRAMLRQGPVLAAVAVFAITFLGNALFVVYLPTWLEKSIGIHPEQIASLFLAGGVANVLAGPRTGRLSDRIGRKRVIIGASIGLAAVVFCTPLLARSYPAVLLLFVVNMMLVAARVGPLQALLTQLVPGTRRGSLMSLTVGMGQLGFAVGGLLAAGSYERFGYLANTAASAFFMLLSTVIVWRGLPEPHADHPGVRSGAAARA
ncbi:MAG: MFS transporter [Gemmatimonadetes bacterium]|nr:MFS transporter [Gemmatimonadota bacterium]